MKKKLLCVAAIAAGFMFSEVKAQTISVGPRLGLNFSTVSTEGDEDEDLSMVTGIHAGAAVNIGLGDMFSIQPEILYTQKGYSYKFEEDFMGQEMSIEQDLTVNYLQIPILARVSFGDDMKFFVNAGPSFGFAMGGTAKSSVSFMGQSEEEEEDIETDDMNMDLGLMLGAGIGINAGPGMFTLEGRYDLGLNETAEGSETKNRTIGVSISYMFPIGG